MTTTELSPAGRAVLARLPGEVREALRTSARLVRLAAGAPAFQPGMACDNFILVLEGAIRVLLVAESGREIVLYRVEPGQSCILTTACLMARDDYPADAVAETAVVAGMVAADRFDQLLDRSPAFRSFVFAEYGRRLLDLMLVLEEVAFRRIDVRLAKCLCAAADTNGVLALSHQELATELGTAREVISRQLKAFEQRGWITLERRRVLLRAPDALRTLARGERPIPLDP